mgnify:CR=1 FL=1
MTWMPFLCLAIGFFIGMRNLTERMLKKIDGIINIALVVLMLTIGINIGINDSVMSNLDSIGLHCLAISLSAIAFSVLFTVIIEKTVLPLDKLKEKLSSENININSEIDISKEEKSENSTLVWIMPVSIVIGVIIGYFLMSYIQTFLLDYMLIGSLITLYVSVGISLSSNKKVFKYTWLSSYLYFNSNSSRKSHGRLCSRNPPWNTITYICDVG